VPFTLIHAGKYRTKDKLKIQTTHKLNTTQKNKQRKTQQTKTTLVLSLLTTLRQDKNKVGLFYNALWSPHGAQATGYCWAEGFLELYDIRTHHWHRSVK